jgi:hypothetical protein
MEVELREKTDFANAYYQGVQKMKKVTRIPQTAYYKLRLWKEFYYRFAANEQS